MIETRKGNTLPCNRRSSNNVNQMEAAPLPAGRKRSTSATMLVCLIAGVVAGYALAAFVVYQPQVASLQEDLSNTRADLSALQADYDSLRDDYAQLGLEHSSLNVSYWELYSDHSRLLSDYSELSSEHGELEDAHSDTTSNYKSLSNEVRELCEVLISYSFVPEAFRRVLNDGEVQMTSDAVSSATGSSQDFWPSVENIYDYIVSNIRYVNDIEMPYLSAYRQVKLEGFDYITGFTVTTYKNYVQTPGLTLEVNQGDCDDQAVLAYAMIKYYMKRIHMTEYILYIARLEFSNGDAHLAVFQPVQEGQLCIIDPAGKYLTSRWGSIASEEALPELRAYSDYWLGSAGGISHIELYDVDVTDGSYALVGEGNIDQVAPIFK